MYALLLVPAFAYWVLAFVDVRQIIGPTPDSFPWTLQVLLMIAASGLSTIACCVILERNSRWFRTNRKHSQDEYPLAMFLATWSPLAHVVGSTLSTAWNST